MNIVITGNQGTLGNPLTNELRRRGHNVFGIDLKHSNSPSQIRADVSDFRQLAFALKKISEQCKKIDIVYHLAAEFGRINGEEYYEEVWKTNVIGTRNLLEIQKILEKDQFKLIFASSSERYGDLDAEVITEDMGHGVLSNDYAISKLVNEMQINNFRQRYQNEVMTLRFFNAYGPGEFFTNYRSVCCLFCYQALHNLSLTVYKDYHRVFMFIDDFIPTLANVADRFKDGEVVNIGGQEYRSVEELAKIVLKCAGKPESLINYIELDKHNVTNKRPDISKAKKLLDHNPVVCLEDGIAKTIVWMKGIYNV